MDLLRSAERNAPHFIELRRALHAHAESAFCESYATEAVTRELNALGITVVPNGDKTGVIGILEGALPGKTVALRAEMDALALCEESGEPFAARNGNCHACGHDIHTAALLGAAALLAERRSRLCGTVRFLFQPAEEGLRGAKTMLASGAMEAPVPDCIIAGHSWPDLPAGTVGYRYGAMMAASDRFHITIHAPGAHAAYPHKSADPVVVMAAVILQLQTVVSRETDPLAPAVVTVGKAEAGTAANIIPTRAELEGTVRTFDPAVRDRIRSSIERIARCTAEAMNATAEFEYRPGSSPVINDETVLSAVVDAARTLLGTDKVIPLNAPSMGGEDFSFYLETAPGALFRIGTADEREASRLALHNPRIVFNERAIVTGSAVMAGAALLLTGSDRKLLTGEA